MLSSPPGGKPAWRGREWAFLLVAGACNSFRVQQRRWSFLFLLSGCPCNPTSPAAMSGGWPSQAGNRGCAGRREAPTRPRFPLALALTAGGPQAPLTNRSKPAEGCHPSREGWKPEGPGPLRRARFTTARSCHFQWQDAPRSWLSTWYDREARSSRSTPAPDRGRSNGATFGTSLAFLPGRFTLDNDDKDELRRSEQELAL
jgi:hypothetical protein